MEPSLTTRCARCGHAYAFHGKALDTPCRAVGCSTAMERRGLGSDPCPGFLDPSEALVPA